MAAGNPSGEPLVLAGSIDGGMTWTVGGNLPP
jgi:hypothetical protein